MLFLPPYAPEYNPIEQVWSKLNELLRRAETLTNVCHKVVCPCLFYFFIDYMLL